MSENSAIEWTDHTFNAWIGCTKVSPACDHCYAENWGKRFGVEWGAGKKRRLTSDDYWRKPLAWNAKAARTGTRPKVFANSLSDVFDAEVSDEWRDRLFALIAMTPNLDWLILTKRPKVARDYFTLDRHVSSDFPLSMSPLWHIGMYVDQPDWHDIKDLPLPNLWLGTTVENQAMADMRIPLLLDTPAAKRFLSCEPLLESVDLSPWLWGPDKACKNCPKDIDCDCYCYTRPELKLTGLDLVIAGGESGKGSRPSHPDWFRSLRDQSAAAGVPFFFKQWGDWLPIDLPAGGGNFEHNKPTEVTDIWSDGAGYLMERVGKKAAGRLLDGREWSELPA